VRLSPADADLFYRLMWRLQFYVNQQHQVIRDVGSIAGYAVLSTAEKMPVRDVLWENPRLIGAYAANNPDGLSTEELEIVRRWKRFVAGTFYIVRYLKKHTILPGDGDVYGVLALNQSLEELLPGRPLPIAVKAVLLPFKGIVIYDGLLSSYHRHHSRPRYREYVSRGIPEGKAEWPYHRDPGAQAGPANSAHKWQDQEGLGTGGGRPGQDHGEGERWPSGAERCPELAARERETCPGGCE